MDGGRSRGAGVFDARGALEAQIGRGLQHQRGGEILGREAGIEVAEHDLVDVACGNAGIGERVGGHAHDQALDGRLEVEDDVAGAGRRPGRRRGQC